ncbi:hypothetical protein ACQ27_gp305 [Klebsiella phage K64-1]|nr:hypothetical protein ACQ27_gp305 [Klebsiella phage K64-1]
MYYKHYITVKNFVQVFNKEKISI